MNITTAIGFLLGKRQAILDVANTRGAIWLGLLFVISAGFAREYDQEDLVHAPWYLLAPLAASLVTSGLLFLLLHVTLFKNKQTPARLSWDRYEVFLSLYWMTAPLAWLYAFPIERLAAPAIAAETNLWLLGIVSLWRVALMTRIVSVIYERPVWAAFFVVMLFADTVVLGIFFLTPLPNLNIRGGIGLSDSENLIQATGLIVMALAMLSWFVWLIGASFAIGFGRRTGNPWSQVKLSGEDRASVARGLWWLAIASIVVWFAFLPFTQVEQMNRRLAETELRAGYIDIALRYMSDRERGEFPPHWDPPPQLGYGEETPPLLDLILRVEQADVAPWVRDLYREKLAVQATRAERYFDDLHVIKLADMDDEQLARYAGLVPELPFGKELAKYHEREIEYVLQYEPGTEGYVSEPRRGWLEAILKLIPPNERDPYH